MKMKIKPVHISVLVLLFLVFWFWPRKKQMYETQVKTKDEKCKQGYVEISSVLCVKD